MLSEPADVELVTGQSVEDVELPEVFVFVIYK